MLSKRIGCRHAGERHVFVVITSPISQDPRKFARILPQRRRWLLPTVSIDYESNHAAPHASGPGLEQNRGLRTVTGGTMMLPMYILARGVSAAQNAGVFFFFGETHHSPFVMDQPCPYLVFSVWVASCKAWRLQTLNQLQTPVVFNYWMEILSLQ